MYMVNYYKVRKYFNSFHLQVDEENSIYVREYGKKMEYLYSYFTVAQVGLLQIIK